VLAAPLGTRFDDHSGSRERGDEPIARQEPVPLRPKARRVLGDEQALLADPMEQGGVARGVGHVDAGGEYRDGVSVGRQRSAMRRFVDAVGAAGHHHRIPLRQAGGQLRGDMLAVRGRGASSDDRRRSLRHLVEPRRPRHPQRQRWMRFRPLLRVDTCEGREGQQRPFVVHGRDQASTQSLQGRQIFRSTVDLMTRLGETHQLVVDRASLHPGRGFDGSHAGDQC
jgi:hypothetical protein